MTYWNCEKYEKSNSVCYNINCTEIYVNFLRFYSFKLIQKYPKIILGLIQLLCFNMRTVVIILVLFCGIYARQITKRRRRIYSSALIPFIFHHLAMLCIVLFHVCYNAKFQHCDYVKYN